MNKAFVMILSRWDRPGQSAQGPVSPRQAWFAANADARICRIIIRYAESRGAQARFRMMDVAYGALWSHQTHNLSDATPIARGNTPQTIMIPISFTVPEEAEITGSGTHTGRCHVSAAQWHRDPPASLLAAKFVHDAHGRGEHVTRSQHATQGVWTRTCMR